MRALLSRLKKGFTLIEILVAIGIMGACLIPVLTMMQSGQQKSTYGEFHLFAHIRAMRMMERLTSFSFNHLVASCNDADGMVEVLPPEYLNKVNMEGFGEECAVDEYDAPEGVYTIEVTVYWKVPGKTQREGSYTLRRIMRKRSDPLMSDYLLGE